MATHPPTKKQKISDSHPSPSRPANTELPDDPQYVPCRIFDLPNELIDQITSWISHPEDMLSLARSSKHFCDRLVGKGASFMWRRVRKQFQPLPIPRPPLRYTESSWAAFIFGGHLCASCGKKTYELPWSFALRVHLCRKCFEDDKWINNEIFTRTITIPDNVRTMLLSLGYRPDEFVKGLVHWLEQTTWNFALKKEVDQALEALTITCGYEASLQSGVLQDLQGRSQSISVYDTVAKTHLEWSKSLKEFLESALKAIKREAEDWATGNGFDYEALNKSQAFREILGIVKRQRLAHISPLLEAHQDELTMQTSRIHSCIDARKLNNEIQRNRTLIERYYNEHVSGQDCHPSLATLRALPTIKLIITRATSDSTSNLPSKPIQGLIESELKDWMNRARNSARRMLGYGDPSNQSGRGRKTETKVWRSQAGKLDPEMRPTALFECVVCHSVERRYKRTGVLDFAGLCNHVCMEKHKAKGDRTPWASKNFVLASRANDVVKKMLELVSRHEHDPEVLKFLEDSTSWICNHCPPHMRPMSYQDMIRHAQRHKIHDISYLSLEADIPQGRVDPNRPYSFADLIHNKEEAGKKQFSCVHCRAKEQYEIQKRQKMMDFNGIRSHLKSKHGIEDIRNEDFFFNVVNGTGSLDGFLRVDSST